MKVKFEEIVYEGKNGTRKPIKDDQLFYVGLEHLENNTLSISRFGSKTPLKTTMKVMKKGDVLFGRRNAYLRRTGIAPHDGLCSGDIMILYPIETVINKDFLPFFLSSDYFFDIMIDRSTGSIMKRAMWSKIKNIEFALPPLSEQKKLGELLWAMENTKQAYKKLIKATDNLIKAKFIEMFGDPETNPMGWEVKRMWEVTAWDKKFKGVLKSKQKKKVIKYPYLLANELNNLVDKNGDVYLLTTSSFLGYTTIEKAANYLCEGEIVSIPWGGYANIQYYKGKFVTSDNRIATSVNIKILSNLFLYFYMLQINDYIQSLYRGAGIQHPDMAKVLDIPIFIPPLPLQQEFSNFVEQIDRYKSSIRDSLSALEASMRGILNGCFGE